MMPYADVNGNGACDKGERWSAYNGLGWAISASCANPDAAYSLISYFCNEAGQKKQAELLEPVQKKAQDAINKVAKAGGYIVVFDVSIPNLAYIDESQTIDIAPAVKKELQIEVKPATKK
jgi:maltose-binding protein MalE